MNAFQKHAYRLTNLFQSLKRQNMKEFAKSEKKRLSARLKRQRQHLANIQQDTLRFALAEAEDPEYPNRESLLAIYKDVYRDLHLQSQIRTAIYKVISEPWAVVDPKTEKEDKELTNLLQKQWFEDLSWLSSEAEFWGTTLIEFGQLVEDPDDGIVFKDVKLFPREHVCPERGLILINPQDRHGLPYREAPFNNWLLEAGDPYDLGLLQYAARYSIYKKFSLSDWSRSGEKWTDPLLVIRSASDDEAENDKKEEFAANFGNNGYAIVDDDDEVELLERKAGQGAHLVWLDFIKLQNEENSKGVNGQVGSSDERSFVGSAEVHERILNDYTEARLRSLMYFHTDKTLPYLAQVNGGNTAYAGLKGKAWMPYRFTKEFQEERARREQEKQDREREWGMGGSPGGKPSGSFRYSP